MRRTGIAALLIFGVSQLVIFAPTVPAAPKAAKVRKETQSAAEKASATERALYLVSMNLIEREWSANHITRVLELLAETKDSRYRGFEWGYWNRLCHQDRMTLLGHAGGVMAAAISPDGKSLLTAGWDDRTVKIRERTTGKVIQTIEAPKQKIQEWGFNSAAFSPDGKRIVTTSNYIVRVWDVQSGKEILSIAAHHGAIRALFSPDGSRIATAGLDGWAKMFDAQTGKEIFTIKERAVGSLYTLAFSPDGKRYASGNDDGTVLVWDTANGTQIFALKGHTDSIAAVTFSPDNKKLLSGSYDTTAKVWDADTGKEFVTLRGHTGAVRALAFFPDGKTIVTGSADSSARCWNIETGKEVRALQGHEARINTVAVSPDGQQILTGSDDNTAKLWDTGQSQEALPLQGKANRLVLAGDEEGKRGKRPGNSELPFLLFGRGVKPKPISPNGKYVIAPAGTKADVWEIETGKHLCTLEGHTGILSAFAFSPDSTRIATGSEDKTAKLWETVSGKNLQTFQGHTGAVKTLTLFPDNRRLVTGSMDATARVWDIASGKTLQTLAGHTGEVYAVSVHCKGNRIATGGRDGEGRIWSGVTGRLICILPKQSHIVFTGLTLSPDGTRAAVGLANPMLWNGQTGKEISTMRGIHATYAPLAFSPDSKRLMVGGDDGVAKLYDAETGKELLTFVVPRPRFWITHIGFSVDGKSLVLHNGDNLAVYLSDAEAKSVTVAP